MHTFQPFAALPAVVALLAALLPCPSARAASQAPPSAEQSSVEDYPDVALFTAAPSPALRESVLGTCDRVRQARYSCRSYIGERAQLPLARSILEGPGNLALGAFGSGDADQVQLHDGVLGTEYFQSLPSGALRHKVIFFATPIADPLMAPAVMAAGARTFISGNASIPPAKARAVFVCFWERVLLDRQAMRAALTVCENSEGAAGHFTIRGDGGRFSDSLIGDKDNFHAGDAADVAYLSPRARGFIDYLTSLPGQGPALNLDTPAQRNAVGLSHFLAVPRNYPLEAASVALRFKMTGEPAHDDIILNNRTRLPDVPGARVSQIIALRDLLGRRAPVAGQTYNIVVDLAHVPIRTYPQPSYDDYLSDDANLTFDAGRFRALDLVFFDNTMVDYSDLVIKQYPVETWVRDLIGDHDDFHAGDAEDVAPKSPHVSAIIAYFAGLAGGAGGALDAGAAGNTAGLTHEIELADQKLVTSATLNARVRVNADAAAPQVIFYNESAVPTGAEPQSGNVIALRDLIGGAPVRGRTYNLNVNLSKVPLRARIGSGHPGRPDRVGDLLGMLRSQRRLDLVFGPGIAVDYSELTLTYATPQGAAGDLDSDKVVNRRDLAIATAGLNTLAYGVDDPRDLDHDGRITVLDARRLAALCTYAGCAYSQFDAQ